VHRALPMLRVRGLLKHWVMLSRLALSTLIFLLPLLTCGNNNLGCLCGDYLLPCNKDSFDPVSEKSEMEFD
jgi:hypothetical protein